MKASDLLVQCLENEGIEYIFGVPGEENADFMMSLEQSERITFILCRHEQGAHEWDQADAACRDAVEGAANRLAQADAELTELAPPDAFIDLVEAQKTVLSYEGARSYASEYQRAPELLSAGLRGEIENGLAIPHADYVAAWGLAGHCQGLMRGILEEHDCLLAPSAAGEAPVGEATGDPLFNRVWTFLHAACLTLPAARGPNGMPIGVQAIAAAGRDDHLLSLGQWMEAALSMN